LIKDHKQRKSWATEDHDILDGKAVILRVRKQSGDVWQFRMWIPEEQKYIRKSLKTRDFETAKQRAEDIVFQTMSDIVSGKKLFGVSLGELIQKYEEWREEDVEVGDITPGRLVTIKSQLKHLLAYKGADTKLSELDRSSCWDYAVWRKKTKKGVRGVTIRNEQSTINHMMKEGYRKKCSHIDGFDFKKIKISKDEPYRRGTFTLEEYDHLVRYMRTYCSKKECPNENERLERFMVRDAILIASNTMLRPGELWNLKWGDVSVNKKTDMVTIEVPTEIAKTRERRTVISRGGQYFRRLRERTPNAKEDDYIFCSIGGNKKLSKHRWYYYWKELMEGVGIDYKKRNITYYSARHLAITCRIKAGVPLGTIAKLAGTGVAFIEKHYGHYDTQMLESAARKSFKIDKDGIIIPTME
jgi:integrase